MKALTATALIVVSFLTICAEARVFYVATNGRNTNSGTINSPWKTISYAVGSSSGINPGDTIKVRSGNYSQPNGIYPLVSGTPNAMIVLMNYDNETVTINPGYIRFNSGKNYWKLQGLAFMHSGDNGIHFTGTHAVGSLVVSYCTFSYHQENGIILVGPDFGGVTINDCTIEWNGEIDGVPTGSEGSGIVMYGSAGKIWARRNLIAHNWAKGISHGTASDWQADSSIIDSNLVIDNFESGMDWWGDNSYIRYNYFSLNGTRDTESEEWGDKGLAIANNASGNLIAFNVIKSSGRWELDPRGSNNYFLHNTLIKDHYYTAVPGSPYAATIIFWAANGAGNYFKNNIIINLCSQRLHHYAIIAETYQRYTDQIWDNNLYWCPNPTSPSPENKPFKLYNAPGSIYKTLAEIKAQFPPEEAHSLYANPEFWAYPDSLWLRESSPAVNAGAILQTPFNFPYIGSAPDIGRFEYTGTDSPPWLNSP
ncbi:MAG: right-handed parallel beta-helix repeat-containing protein [bacterium]|nr:right-handed parallel beta-helix repeat-containing protein [bacterium]